jgi:hypothetical protein
MKVRIQSGEYGYEGTASLGVYHIWLMSATFAFRVKVIYTAVYGWNWESQILE